MIYVTGDIHGNIDISKLNNTQLDGKGSTKKDYLIIAGDFGLVWQKDSKQDKYWQKWLSDKPYTTLFVDGNHENHELLSEYPIEKWKGGKVHRINDSILHLMRGQVYEIAGKRIFTFGGARSSDKQFRVEGRSWWANEQADEDEKHEAFINLERYDNKVDYVITHTCPTSILKEFDADYRKDSTSDFLDKVKDKIIFKNWYFGHFHVDMQIDSKFTLLYNQIIEIGEIVENRDTEYDITIPDHLALEYNKLLEAYDESFEKALTVIEGFKENVNKAYYNKEINETAFKYLTAVIKYIEEKKDY